MPHIAFLTPCHTSDTTKRRKSHHTNGIDTNFTHSEHTNIPISRLTDFQSQGLSHAKIGKSHRMHTDHAHAVGFSQIRMQNRKLDTNSITSRRNLKIAQIQRIIGRTIGIFKKIGGRGRGIGRQTGRGSHTAGGDHTGKDRDIEF